MDGQPQRGRVLIRPRRVRGFSVEKRLGLSDQSPLTGNGGIQGTVRKETGDSLERPELLLQMREHSQHNGTGRVSAEGLQKVRERAVGELGR